MKNIAIIFAGGSGSRMKTVSKPKQFLELNGKPVIIYTLELFDNHPEIDGIVVVCIEPWISFLMKQLKKFEISKVGAVVPGGKTGQDSIYNGLIITKNTYGENCNVLIHDGVRPLIKEQTISECIITTIDDHGQIAVVGHRAEEDAVFHLFGIEILGAALHPQLIAGPVVEHKAVSACGQSRAGVAALDAVQLFAAAGVDDAALLAQLHKAAGQRLHLRHLGNAGLLRPAGTGQQRDAGLRFHQP